MIRSTTTETQSQAHDAVEHHTSVDSHGPTHLSDTGAGSGQQKQLTVVDHTVNVEVDGEGGIAEGASAAKTSVALGATGSGRTVGTTADKPTR